MSETHSKNAAVGRPRGLNAYGEATTTPVRIPNSKLTVISDYLQRCSFRKELYAIDRENISLVDEPGTPLAVPLYSA